jgi:hypothetical protein
MASLVSAFFNLPPMGKVCADMDTAQKVAIARSICFISL